MQRLAMLAARHFHKVGPGAADSGTHVQDEFFEFGRGAVGGQHPLLRIEPGKPFVYYMGAAWDKGLDFRTEAQWDSYVATQKPDFDPTHD